MSTEKEEMYKRTKHYYMPCKFIQCIFILYFYLSPAQSFTHTIQVNSLSLSLGHHFLSPCQFEIYPSGPILRCNRILYGAPDSDFFTFRLLNKSITKAFRSLLPKWQSRTKKMMMWMIIIKAFRNLATSSSLVGTRSVDLTIKWI